jgi:hypothetical protein
MTTIEPIAASLQSLGFSDYEAKAYISLLVQGPQTGYQVARASGIPRPNIYRVLDLLERRGAAVRVQAKRGTLYSALAADEMLARLSSGLERQLAEARGALATLNTAATPEYVWNVEGYEAVINRANELVDVAQERLIVGLWSNESRRLTDAFGRAQARGVSIATLCIQGCPDGCGGCRGQIYRYPLAEESPARALVLVCDDGQLLTGQVSPDGSASAAVTTQSALVNTAGQYLRNAIAGAEIVRSLGPRLTALLDAQAIQALQGAGLATGGVSWLENMLAAVGEGNRD